jgi:hypothetical protein
MLANIASIAIIALGVIAALNQVGIALTVTLPVLVAVLGTVGGILVVGVGGGLIKPMQGRWEHYLNKAEEESRSTRGQVSSTTNGGEDHRGGVTVSTGAPTTRRAQVDQPQPGAPRHTV